MPSSAAAGGGERRSLTRSRAPSTAASTPTSANAGQAASSSRLSGSGGSGTRSSLRQVRFQPNSLQYAAPEPSSSTSAQPTGAEAGSSTSGSSRRASGSMRSRPIVIDDLFSPSSSNVEQDPDDDFTFVGANTNEAPDRQTNTDLYRAQRERDLEQEQRVLQRELADARAQYSSLLSRSRSIQSAGSSLVTAPRPSDMLPIVRSDSGSSNLHIAEGIPAPSRYRHRERAVHFAQGTPMGSGFSLGQAHARLSEIGGPEEQAFRRFNILPSSRFPAMESRKLPERYDTRWTHPHEVQEGFSHSIVEPPIELDADESAKPTGPLPDTTPICARCRYALQMGGTGDKKVWVLPCGHVIDGKCVRELSDPSRKAMNSKPLQDGESKANGKARAVSREPEAPSLKRTVSERDGDESGEGAGSWKGKGPEAASAENAAEPSPKRRQLDDGKYAVLVHGSERDPIDADASSQSFEILFSRKNMEASKTSTNGKGKATVNDDDDEPVVSAVKLQPAHFTCPVVGCGQLCFPKGDHDLSIIEMFL